MSKSYGNDIAISATGEEVRKRANAMITDPGRVRREDLGNPDICIVNKYQEIYNNSMLESIRSDCRTASRGCVECKKEVYEVIENVLAPIRQRRANYENSTYENLREYLQELNKKSLEGGNTDSERPETDESLVNSAFDRYWKSSGKKDKETLKKNGQQVIADYNAGLISIADVQCLLDAKFDFVNLVLVKGRERAYSTAADTIKKVRAAMNLRY